MLLVWSFIWYVFQLNDAPVWAMTDIGNIIKLFHPVKWWSLGGWGSCPFGNLQACLHVSFHLSLPVIRSLFRSHHLLSSNHWRIEEKRKEAHSVTWACVSSGCLVGPRAESPPQTPSCVWKQLLSSPPGVSLTQTKVPWTDLTTCHCSR